VHLYLLPLLFALAGLAFYTVLGGADFGSGFWQLAAGGGSHSTRIREHARHAIGPVWEANHVWLIFVLTVMWTAYPVAFASIASTLSVPLFIAAVGIILRGIAYALRAGAGDDAQLRGVDRLFSISSIATPFALGAAVGGIASLRVPVGNAAGNLVSSWLNPTSITIGVLAVGLGAYMAAVFLSGDAARIGDDELEAAFRRRALASGLLAGAIAFAALAAIRFDAHRLFDRLVLGRGAPALVVSAAAGVATLALVWKRRYEPARFSAAVAVAAIIGGWALAQAPVLIDGLTVKEAAAPHETIVALVAAVVLGGLLLFPSLALLFGLVLRGTFDPTDTGEPTGPTRRDVVTASRHGLLARLSVAALLAGIGLTTFSDAAWMHGVGVACLCGFVVLAVPAALPHDP
jgi:cytochrome bd ubiquinol oxidase subunit II